MTNRLELGASEAVSAAVDFVEEIGLSESVMFQPENGVVVFDDRDVSWQVFSDAMASASEEAWDLLMRLEKIGIVFSDCSGRNRTDFRSLPNVLLNLSVSFKGASDIIYPRMAEMVKGKAVELESLLDQAMGDSMLLDLNMAFDSIVHVDTYGDGYGVEIVKYRNIIDRTRAEMSNYLDSVTGFWDWVLRAEKVQPVLVDEFRIEKGDVLDFDGSQIERAFQFVEMMDSVISVLHDRQDLQKALMQSSSAWLRRQMS